MKRFLVLPLVLLVGLQSQAATVKAKLDDKATESQAQEAKTTAEQASGQQAQVIRDENGKVESVVIALPDHDNAGIERAKEALLQNEGVATVTATITLEPITAQFMTSFEAFIVSMEFNPYSSEQISDLQLALGQFDPEYRLLVTQVFERLVQMQMSAYTMSFLDSLIHISSFVKNGDVEGTNQAIASFQDRMTTFYIWFTGLGPMPVWE